MKQDAKDRLNEDLNNFRGSVLLKHKIKNYNGEIFYLGDSYKINFRLKGRLSDHRDNNRISLNVNMKDKKQILSMNKFSIQYPSTRNNLYELIGNYFLRYNNHIYSNTKIGFLQAIKLIV